jgi:hypothetical protein
MKSVEGENEDNEGDSRFQCFVLLDVVEYAMVDLWWLPRHSSCQELQT